MWENAGKMRTRITPNTDTFCAAKVVWKFVRRLIFWWWKCSSEIVLKRSKVCKYFVQDCTYPRFKFSLQKIESLIIIGAKSNQNRIYSRHLSFTRKSLLYRITFPELISFRKKNFDKLFLTSFFNSPAKSICNSVPFEI